MKIVILDRDTLSPQTVLRTPSFRHEIQSWGRTAAEEVADRIAAADIVVLNKVKLTALFTHPMEGGPTMDMGLPVRFGVLAGGKAVDLQNTLSPVEISGKKAFEASYQIKAPGDYVFFLQPAPYWEAAEKHFLSYDKLLSSSSQKTKYLEILVFLLLLVL